MPYAAPTPCRTCGRLHCPTHPRTTGWAARSPQPRIRGRALQRIRQELHAAQPWCAQCRRVLTFSSTGFYVDHIVNLAAGGTDTPDNRQLMCAACHEHKRQQESLRGRGLA